jgi:hypothetical protein
MIPELDWPLPVFRRKNKPVITITEQPSVIDYSISPKGMH